MNAANSPINHPSFSTTGSLPQDEVAKAIKDSVSTGVVATCRHTTKAVEILSELCDHEFNDEYTYQGVNSDGNAWTVSLVD